jgi:hypothetical protein
MTRSTPLSCLLALAAASGCGETTNAVQLERAFDRPVDIAFACHGGLRITNGGSPDPSQELTVSAMPTSACETRSTARLNAMDPAIVPFGQEDPKLLGDTRIMSPVLWYGLVLESGPGTVGVVELSIQAPSPAGTLTQRIVDMDPLTPGTNGISVGEDPVAIVTDPAGCHAITANAGSCDLSVLDLNSALDVADNLFAESERAAKVDRLGIKNASGEPIRARPAAMVGEPPSAAIGFQCPAAPTGLVYVAYPGCHLVAGVDASTGTIVTGIQYDAAGVPSIVGGDVTCPAECGGGGIVTPGVRPVALDLELDPRAGTRRLVIGADNSASIAIVELDDATRPLSVSQVALEDPAGTLGVTALALSPEMGMGGGNAGGGSCMGKRSDAIDDEAAGGAFQFVYAIATDGTVRVADVLDVRSECDTQVDPRFARGVDMVRELSCFPAGAVTTPPRRAGARSPGIHLPGSAIPLSVDFVRVDRLPLDPQDCGTGEPPAEVVETRDPDAPGTLVGYFAAVSTSNGGTFLVNVDDDDFPDVFDPNAPLAVPVPLAMAHQLRDAAGSRHVTINDEDTKPDDPADDRNCLYGGRAGAGAPRISAPPERRVQEGSVAPVKLIQLPGFRQILCDRRALHPPPPDQPAFEPDPQDQRAIPELMYAAPDAERDRAFPDLAALPPEETWTLVWEGSLSLNGGNSDIDGPAIREGMLAVDGFGLHVLDGEKSFCEAGVEPFDIVQLRGCDPQLGATDCPSGYTCFVHPESNIQGLGACMLSDEASRLAGACKDFLTTSRRYTVKTTASGELLAMPRRHELRTTPLDGCVSDQQCEDLADYAARSGSSSHPSQDNTAPDPGTWACVADPLRAPKGGTGKRCELKCSTSADCVTGTVCQGAIAEQPMSGFCMEGVIPPQACINATQRYELRAGEAFAVNGSRSGFVHPIIENASGACVRDPMASHLSIGRLPLVPRDPLAPNTVHACDPTADPISGRLPNGTFEPNPCLTTSPHTEVLPVYVPDGTCTQAPVSDSDPTPRFEFVERLAPAVRFRNRNVTFTLVDPHYPGDGTCLTDRQGNLGQIPHVVPGYTISFHQTGGLSPLQLLASGFAEDRPSFPVKVTRGPANTLWVVDEGDFLSSSAGSPSTRGKVFRVEPLAPGAQSVFK